jgi:hypothetical protein
MTHDHYNHDSMTNSDMNFQIYKISNSFILVKKERYFCDENDADVKIGYAKTRKQNNQSY